MRDSKKSRAVQKAKKARKGNGQGWSSNPYLNKCLENHAERLAIEYYESSWDSVKKVGKPYDLECRRGEEVLHVEVKGTSQLGYTVCVTPNEVENARKNNADLFVVSNIDYEKISEIEYKASGGDMWLFQGWKPKDEELRVRTFELRIDPSQGRKLN